MDEAVANDIRIQPYLNPSALFAPEAPGATLFWTCVRTRPRWEKKFADWAQRQNLTYFMPTIQRETVSHRKRVLSTLPLFSGFVFVQGDCEKKDFARSESVVYLLKPESPAQIKQLHGQLWNIWKSLACGSPVELTGKLEKGTLVEVIGGPLTGAQGTFQKWGARGRLVVSVDLLGVALVVELPEYSVVRKVE